MFCGAIPCCRSIRRASQFRRRATGLSWISHQRSTHMVGHDPDNGFSFDNELPRHEALLHGFEIASRPVTSGEFLEFIADGGYKTAGLWLSEGWDHVRRNDWSGPLYWEQADGRWRTFTLGGLVDVDPVEPVCHVSYFEADAFARWSGLRLPTEFEWEVAAADVKTTTAVASGNFVESNRLHPAPASASEAAMRSNGPGAADVRRCLGVDVQSRTSAYPGYQLRPKAPWANTTASSCAISSCCVVDRARRRGHTFVPPIETSFSPKNAGSSAGSDWLASRPARGPGARAGRSWRRCAKSNANDGDHRDGSTVTCSIRNPVPSLCRLSTVGS